MPLRMGEAQASGVPWARVSARAVLASWGRISNGISKAHRGKTHRHCVHIADETTRYVVGLVESAYLLATTGRCNGMWNGRQVEMAQDARDYRLLGDGGNDLE